MKDKYAISIDKSRACLTGQLEQGGHICFSGPAVAGLKKGASHSSPK
jgi:hypothetical protein